MVEVYGAWVGEAISDESQGIGWFSAAYLSVIGGEPARFFKGLNHIAFFEFLGDLVNPVGCIENNIAVDDCKLGVLGWYDLLEFIDELFFIEHV